MLTMLWIIDQIFVLVFFAIYPILFVLLLVLSVKTMPNGDNSNLAFSNIFGLYPKSSPVKYSYFSRRSLDDNAEILAASLPKSYWAWFDLILSSKILIWPVTVMFVRVLKDFS